MHPKMIIALGRQLEEDRLRERRQVEQRSRVRVARVAASHGSGSPSMFARRPFAGLSLRPGLS